MSDVPLALVRLTHGQLSRLAAEEPGVRWPRALRGLVAGRREAVHLEPAERGADPLPPDLFSDQHAALLLRRGLRAFGHPRLRVRVVLRQGRLLTLTEVAADADGSAGSLSTLLLDGPPTGTPPQVRPVGRVELAGAAASTLPCLGLRHVPGAFGGSSSPATPRAGRPGAHPARTVVLRGWGRALARPFVDAWAQDEYGWVRPRGAPATLVPVGGDAATGWLTVDAGRFAADLAAVLTEPLWPRGPDTERERR